MPSKMRSSEGIAFEANTDIVFNTTASSAAPKEQKNYLAPMPLDYVVGKPPFLEITAPGLAADTGEVGKWEPKRHLDYQPPSYVYDLDFNRHAVSDIDTVKNSWSGFGFTAPFKLLSSEGVKKFKETIGKTAQNYPFAVHREALFPASIRGMGYTSEFLRESVQSPEMLGILNSLCGDVIAPDTLPLNYCHTNLGLPPQNGQEAKSAAKWHSDSVQYVLVIMLCDTSQMEGGELLVAAIEDHKAREMVETPEGVERQLAKDKMLRVRYPGEGWAIFMQGAKFYHAVAPVKSCHPDHPRLSVVNSYQSLRLASAPDYSIGEYYASVDPLWLSWREYLSHKAWRANEILKYAYQGSLQVRGKPTPGTQLGSLAKSMQGWIADSEKDREEGLKLLDLAIKELEQAREVMAGTKGEGYMKPFQGEGSWETLVGNPFEYLLKAGTAAHAGQVKGNL